MHCSLAVPPRMPLGMQVTDSVGGRWRWQAALLLLMKPPAPAVSIQPYHLKSVYCIVLSEKMKKLDAECDFSVVNIYKSLCMYVIFMKHGKELRNKVLMNYLWVG